MRTRSPDSQRVENPLRVVDSKTKLASNSDVAISLGATEKKTERVDLHLIEFIILVALELYTSTIIVLLTIVAYCDCWFSSQGPNVRIVYSATTLVRAAYSV